MAKLELSLKFEMKNTILAIEAMKSIRDQLDAGCTMIAIEKEQAQALLSGLIGEDGLPVVKFETVKDEAPCKNIGNAAVDVVGECLRCGAVQGEACRTPPADWDGKIST